MTQVNIDTDLSLEYRDSGTWRSYHLTASGSTYAELLQDATIEEIDQDGGEIRCYGVHDLRGDDKAQREAISILQSKVGL